MMSQFERRIYAVINARILPLLAPAASKGSPFTSEMKIFLQV